MDWESVKDKYENIRSLFIKNRRDENDNETFTRDKISSKIKAVRGNYRKAVDTGRQRGGGRVVATFYELCQEIWAGSPATESIASGVESSCYTNNDDYNEPIDFNPGTIMAPLTRVMKRAMKQNFQKPTSPFLPFDKQLFQVEALRNNH